MLGARVRFAFIVQNALLAIVYAGAAELGLRLDPVGGFATLVWAPTGIALAALLLGGLPLWPGIALGAFVANVWTGASATVALGIATGNTLEAVVGAYVLREVVGFRNAIDRLRDALALILIAAFSSTLISATIGASSLLAGDIVTSSELARTWRAWWLGDAIGALIVAPLILTWSELPRFHHKLRRWIETSAFAVAVVGLGFFTFYGPASVDPDPLGQRFMLFPLLIWAALRFDQRAVTATMSATSAFAVVGVMHGRGPFIRSTLVEGLIHLQAFMVVAAVTALVLGAVFAERRRAQEENVRLLRRAEEAVQARDEFLSIASHELRTPLSALVLHLASLLRLVGHSDAPDVEGLRELRVRKAIRSTERLTKLVDSLLDVSRIAAGRLQLAPEECDLSEITRDVVDRASDEARRAGSELRMTMTGPVKGSWDPLRLEQVVANLLSNAIKYGAPNPIDVSVGTIDDAAVLSVRDYGIGISHEDAARIFARFERAVSPQQYGGLGLGLYITRQIVEAHGGSVNLRSREGAGAEFTIHLPLGGSTVGEEATVTGGRVS